MSALRKKHVFCFDGTWNRIESEYPTNVARIAQAVKRVTSDGTPQIVHYDEGVGTSDFGRVLGWIANRLAGAFGFGLNENIVEAYTHLVFNYEPGDQIYVFGFSRGAFTARSFCGLLNNAAVVDRRNLHAIREAVEHYTSRNSDKAPSSLESKMFRYRNCPNACLAKDVEWLEQAFPNHDHAQKHELKVDYLGVWDTVGALGVPDKLAFVRGVNRKFEFHDTSLSAIVKSARHAVAADEARNTFKPTMWSNIDELREMYPHRYDEKIFPGTHGSVGGGGPIRGLSDAALEWVLRGAMDAGLEVDTDQGSPLFKILPDARAAIHNVTGKYNWSKADKWMGVGLETRDFSHLDAKDLHPSIFRKWHQNPPSVPEDGLYRPDSLKTLHDDIEKNPPEHELDLEDEVFEGIRLEDDLIRPPSRIQKYTVKATDRGLSWIAKDVYGDASKWKIIFLHNFNAGILYDKDELHAQREIEIPFYD